LKPESGVLKSKSQKNKTVVASCESEPKGVKPKVLINKKLSKSHLKVQEVKSKTSSTSLKGPIKNGYLNMKLSILLKCLRGKEKQKSKYLDSGCSRHMTREKFMFLTLTTKEGGNVKFGGNQSGKIIGTGTIGNSSISINNVWLVDCLEHNVLSISQFCDRL